VSDDLLSRKGSFKIVISQAFHTNIHIVPTNAENITQVNTVLTLSIHILSVYCSVSKPGFRKTPFKISREMVE
jgi:hypothetical protein